MEPGKVIFKGKTEKGLTVILRYPKKSDLAGLLSYINTLSKERTFIRVQGEEISLEEEKEYLDKIIKHVKIGQGVHLFAFSGGDLIGTADISLKERAERHVGDFGISIAKEFRGKGVGRLLLGKILLEAKNNLPGLKIVTLSVFANNPIAKKMYESFGFKTLGKWPVLGCRVDVLLVDVFLDDSSE